MACEVRTFGSIHDFRKVQEYFGLSHDDHWLNTVHYAISPTAELIALAHGEKLVLLTAHWDGRAQTWIYTISWSDELDDPNEIVTSVVCLPIQGKSTTTAPEWTCVALGMSSGMVLFYTDVGIKIFSQSYHDTPVMMVKAYSPPSSHSESSSLIYIIYEQCVCIIKSCDLLPLLSNIRHNVYRTLNSSMTMAMDVSGLETADTTPFQKFKFTRERESMVHDAVVAGPQRPCAFDHIVEQCLSAGFYAKVSNYPAQSSIVLSVGAEPCLGLYYAEEGYKLISLSEVAKDVIGVAYKNFFGNLFKRAQCEGSPEELQSPSKEAQMRSGCRFYDRKRDGITIAIAPGNHLAVVTDTLDRVMLVDCQRGSIVRVWKGYRDAQCAFVPVKEQTLKGVSTARRKALFLIIYAPRIGSLEIWALQNGPKVAAFTVSKCGQLSYNAHGILGIQPGSKMKATVNCCLFIDGNDGSIRDIMIPFHYALTENNSKTARDIHLLRRLKNLLRDAGTIDDIATLAAEFQTVEVRQQCVETLKRNKHMRPAVFQAIIAAFIQSPACGGATRDEESESFDHVLDNYKRLVDFYMKMLSPARAAFEGRLDIHDCDLDTIRELVLLLGNRERTNVSGNVGAGKVTFQEPCRDDGDFNDYLSIFQVEQASTVPLVRDKICMYGSVSRRLFGDSFEHGLCFDYFKAAAEQSHIPCEDLLALVLHFWLQKPFTYRNCEEVIADMSRLAAMVRAICDLAGERVNNYDYSEISPWWQDVREMLLENPKSLGLLVAIVCKTVATDLRRSRHGGSCDEGSQAEDDERWEEISHDEAQWGLLIGKLDDISVLGAILEYPISSSDAVMPPLSYEPPDCSLKTIVTGGKGIVTDLTAQWIINAGIHPSTIVEIDNDNKWQSSAEQQGADVEPVEGHGGDEVLQKLRLLREHFPFSLESGAVLSLMSWKYMVHWSKNLPSLEYMRATIGCLAAMKGRDNALKHGMCCMLWNATLKYPLQATAKLVQKVGRLPKEKMCQQDIEMSASLVPDFLELALEFVQHFTSALDNWSRLELRFEETLADGQLPLQVIALQQPLAIRELLQLHTELCTVLYFISFFQLKWLKPLTSVFDAMSNKAFFADINVQPNFVLPAPDIVLQKVREDFLCRVITASMDLIREDLQQLYVADHQKYMAKVCDLADSWRMDKLPLKRQQVIQLYAHGYDAEGEALLQHILDDERIGQQLLEIAGQRLHLYSQLSPDILLKIASVGPELLQYMDNIKEHPSKFVQITATDPADIDIGVLTKLVTNTFKCLPQEMNKGAHIAVQMYGACTLLQEMQADSGGGEKVSVAS